MTHVGYSIDRAYNLVFVQQIWVWSEGDMDFHEDQPLLQEKCAAPFHSESVEQEWMRSARIRKSLRYAAATGTAGLVVQPGAYAAHDCPEEDWSQSI